MFLLIQVYGDVEAEVVFLVPSLDRSSRKDPIESTTLCHDSQMVGLEQWGLKAVCLTVLAVKLESCPPNCSGCKARVFHHCVTAPS